MVKKELTQQEKDEIKLKIESVKKNIVNPIIGITLSACQYHKTFNNWPNVNFAPSSRSDFDNFKILPTESNFHSEFKLKGSEYTFDLSLGVPSTKFNNDQTSHQNNATQSKKDRIKKKLSEKLSTLMTDNNKYKNNNKNQETTKVSGDCEFMIKASHPYNPAKINLSGPVFLGKTWLTDAERTQLASGFFFMSSFTSSIPRKQNSNFLEKLFSNEITNAFIMVSLCSVLGIEPNNCR